MEYKMVESDKRVVELSNEVAILETEASTLVIADEAGYQEASVILAKTIKLGRNWEELRKFFVQPLNEQVKRINGFFKDHSEPLRRTENMTKNVILAYRKEQDQKRRFEEERSRKLAEAQAIVAAEEKGEIPIPIYQAPAPAQAKTVRTAEGTMTARTVWNFRIIDKNLIPNEFKMVNEKAIGAAVKAGVRDISGVEIFQEEILAIK